VSAPVLLLQLATLAVIGLLPRLFFRRDGRLGLMWWLTALPFFVCPVVLLTAYVVHTPVMTWPGWQEPRELVAVLADTGAIALLFFTLGTHRIPLALWHQDNDAPASIVTYGAYRRIRHPFYASFLLTFAGALALFPSWVTLCLLGYAVVVLNQTAAREERRLSTSSFGAEYREYMARTGRFLPRPVRGQRA
jgi:protein-S-isoprenylcysteine O-methyltransferase Ste14